MGFKSPSFAGPTGFIIDDSGHGFVSSVFVGSYSDATRPLQGNNIGDLIYNSTSQGIEAWNGSSWITINPLLRTEITVSPESSYELIDLDGYKTYVFTSSATLSVGRVKSNGTSEIMHYFVVGGGGGTAHRLSGGGGAGGVRNGRLTLQAGIDYPIVIGAGGAGGEPADGSLTDTASSGQTPGNNSSFGPIVATGGGKGEKFQSTAGSGGSGGGTGYSGSGGVGKSGAGGSPSDVVTTIAQGTPGSAGAGGPGIGNGSTGGGGGAGGRSQRAYGPYSPETMYRSGKGGDGLEAPNIHNIPSSYGKPGPNPTGSGRFFAGGGGGGASKPGSEFAPNSQAGPGGVGGGGNGGRNATGQAGKVNMGGGAGGAGQQDSPAKYYPGAAGGSGIVILTIISE